MIILVLLILLAPILAGVLECLLCLFGVNACLLEWTNFMVWLAICWSVIGLYISYHIVAPEVDHD